MQAIGSRCVPLANKHTHSRCPMCSLTHRSSEMQNAVTVHRAAALPDMTLNRDDTAPSTVCFSIKPVSHITSLRSLVHLLLSETTTSQQHSRYGSCSRERQEGARCPPRGDNQLAPAAGMPRLALLCWHLNGAVHGPTQYAGVHILLHFVPGVADPAPTLAYECPAHE